MNLKASVEGRRLLVAQSLQVGNPGNNARDLPGGPDPRGGRDGLEHQIELTVDEIRPYEGNPRRAPNAKFDDIKESIRTSGLRTPLTVTRRTGESHYFVEAGGNTRLLALQQLWAETRDVRFRHLVVLFRPWRSESHVLSAHLIENDQRGEMSFWDKACGTVALKGRLEAELGRTLGIRPLEDALHALGMAVNTAHLAMYLFATERLRTLGEAVAGLTGMDVRGLQPRLNAIKRYVQGRREVSEDTVYAEVFEPVFLRIAQRYPHAGEFTLAATAEACEVCAAEYLGEPVDALRAGLQGPKSGTPDSGAQPLAATGGDGGAIVDGVSSPDREPNAPLAAQRALLQRVRAFAESSGLLDCVEPAPASRAGFRVSAPAHSAGSSPQHRRAWCLLAGISGQLGAEEAAAEPLDESFIRWLADPQDASANAFWEVLACLRQAGGAGAAPDDAAGPSREAR